MALIWKIIATYPGEQAKRGSRKVYKKECLENPIFKYYREKLDTYSALTRMDIDVKAGKSGELPSSFVPGRNLIFLSMAAILAQQIGAKHLVTGVCETDFSGYPDCRDVFVKSLNVTINLAMGQEFVIHTPLMWLDKAATWKMADDLNVLKLIKERTLTCYEGIIGDGCGKCPACQLRRQGYEKYMQMKANVSTAI